MKYIAERGYTDVQLKRHVDKDEPLEEIYAKAGITLTEERKNYLINERKLYVLDEAEPETEPEADTKSNENDTKKTKVNSRKK